VTQRGQWHEGVPLFGRQPKASSSSTGQTIVGSTVRARRLYALHAPVSESLAASLSSRTRSSNSTSRALSDRRALRGTWPSADSAADYPVGISGTSS